MAYLKLIERGKSILKPASLANLLIFIIISWSILNTKFWKGETRVISWDVVSYYAYLPATFIYNDITLKFTDNYKGPHKFVFWPNTAPNGGRVIKTSMGLSYLYAPFFFLGHITAHFLHYDTGGYSPPYKFFLIFGTLFYLMIGLYFLRKILERYFKPYVVAGTLLITVFGTNLFYYATFESTMAHVYNFVLIVIYLWSTIQWYEKQKLKYIILLGILTGLISLIRPSNVLVILIFLLYKVSSFHDLKQRIQFIIYKFNSMLLMILFAVIMWIPQLIYWKIVTGHFTYWSYEGEKFFFTNPQIIEGLFGFRKGWFLYNPVIFIAFTGIFLLFKRLKDFSWLIPVFMVLNIYIILSWWAWWYGGSLGGRAFIDSYVFVALLIALVLQWIAEKKAIIKFCSIAVISLLSIKCIHYTRQYYYGSIHWDAMSKEAYLDSFWRIRPSEKFQQLLKHPDYEKAKLGIQALEKTEPSR